MSSYTIALLDGDGIGPEIMAEAEKILRLAESRNGIRLELEHGAFGAGAWFSHGDSFPQATKELCDRADAILKGPIGLDHEQTEKIPVDMRPERGALLPLRRRFDTFANFRPVRLAGSLTHFSPLKPEIVAGGIVEQAERVIANVIAALDVADCGLEHVVKVNVWLDDPRDFTSFNAVFERHFRDHPPARSTVRSALMVDARVEMDVIAYKPE